MIFNVFKKSDEAITNSQQLAEYLMSGFSSKSGVVVTPHTAMKYAPVFACIRVLSEYVGILPVDVVKVEGKSRYPDTSHYLHRIWRIAPNGYMTPQEFKEMIVAHLCLRGNFYAYINWTSQGVAELLPLNPDSVVPKLKEDYELVYEVTFANGKKDVLTQEKVFHVKGMTLDGVVGLSPISYMRESIGLGIATQEHGGKLFSNGARPGGVLSTEQNLREDTYQRIKESWNDAHKGVENAHKVAILEGGLNWTQVGMTAEDSQFLDTRKFQRSEVAGIFRVPPHMIGDLDKATFGNIEHQWLAFTNDGLMPYVTRIEQRTTFSLLKKKEQGKIQADFNITALLRGDMKSRGDFYTKLVQNGAMSPNEIRANENMNPREGGDVFLTPLNMAINGKPVDGE